MDFEPIKMRKKKEERSFGPFIQKSYHLPIENYHHYLFTKNKMGLWFLDRQTKGSINLDQTFNKFNKYNFFLSTKHGIL